MTSSQSTPINLPDAEPVTRSQIRANDLIRRAVRALTDFGGDGMPREKAAELLMMWPGAAELDEYEEHLVLGHFERAEPPLPAPGWSWMPEAHPMAVSR